MGGGRARVLRRLRVRVRVRVQKLQPVPEQPMATQASMHVEDWHLQERSQRLASLSKRRAQSSLQLLRNFSQKGLKHFYPPVSASFYGCPFNIPLIKTIKTHKRSLPRASCRARPDADRKNDKTPVRRDRRKDKRRITLLGSNVRGVRVSVIKE